MINIFNRRALCENLTPEEAAAVWKKLREAKIPYSVKKSSASPEAAKPSVKIARGGRTGSFTSNAAEGSSITTGIPASWSNKASSYADYYYTIFVNKKDFGAAKKLTEEQP